MGVAKNALSSKKTAVLRDVVSMKHCILIVDLDIHLFLLLVLLFNQGPPRTSALLAPIMLLTGHEGEIFCTKFSPDGQILASAGFDRLLCKSHQ